MTRWNRANRDELLLGFGRGAGDGDVGEQRDEDEVGVDPAVDLPEPLGVPVGVEQATEQECRAPLLPAAREDELMRVPERAAEPGQRPRRLRVLQVRQQAGDHGHAARQVSAVLLVLPRRPRRPRDLGDETAGVPAQMRHGRKLHCSTGTAVVSK